MKKEAGVENESIEQKEAKSSSRSPRRSAGTDQQEIEWQYDAPEGLESVAEWLISGNGGSEEPVESRLTVAAGAAKDLTDVYYDTEDWRLYRAGYALRLRREASSKSSEVTLKALTSADGAKSNIQRRREISEPLEGEGMDVLDKLDRPVGERLKAFVGSRELSPIFEIHTRRRVFELLDDKSSSSAEDSEEDRAEDSSGEIVQDAAGNIRRAGDDSRVGEVALDSSEILLGDGGEVVHLRRVEVEADAAVSSDLKDFVKALEKGLALRPTRISKYKAGLFATGQSPEVSLDLGPDSIDNTLSVGEVAFAVLRQQFAAMRTHEPGVRLGEDPEELHDMRVAMRRMRSAIKLFRDALPERARWFRDELKFFAGVLGDVRDLDVHIEQLEDLISDEEHYTEPLLEIVRTLENRREEARVRLLEALDSTRYERFETSFADMLRRGPTTEAGSEPVLIAAPDLLFSGPYRKWRKAAKRIDGSSSPEEYHELRKKGKQLRYAMEFLSDVYGKQTTNELVKPLKALQDVLGEHQDSIVAGDLLEEVATGDQRLPQRTAFVMGTLAERHRQEAANIRASVPSLKAYRTLVKGKKWEGFEKVMKKERYKAKAASEI